MSTREFMETRDLTIIGAGPTGLAAAFRAGMHKIWARIIDTAAQLGGQVTALYPEKKIYDVFGLPEVLGKELVHDLTRQGLQFGAEVRLGETVTALRFSGELETKSDDRRKIEVITDQRTYLTQAVILAGGLGVITPRRHDAAGCDQLEGKGVYYAVRDPEMFRGKKVVIVGGGDSALDWALNLRPSTAQCPGICLKKNRMLYNLSISATWGFDLRGGLRQRQPRLGHFEEFWGSGAYARSAGAASDDWISYQSGSDGTMGIGF